MPGQAKAGAAATDPDLSGHSARTHTVYLCLEQSLAWQGKCFLHEGKGGV